MSLAVSHLSYDNKRDKRNQLSSALVGVHSRQVTLAAFPFLTRHSWMPAAFYELGERAERDRINLLCSSGFHIFGVLGALHQAFNVLVVTMVSSGLLLWLPVWLKIINKLLLPVPLSFFSCYFWDERGLLPSCSAWASHCSIFSCCGTRALGAQASVVAAGLKVGVHGLSCSEVCGIFPDQGLNLCPLHWQVDS